MLGLDSGTQPLVEKRRLPIPFTLNRKCVNGAFDRYYSTLLSPSSKTASTAKDGGNTCDAWQRISTSVYGLLRAQVPRAAGRLRTGGNFFYADRTRA